MTRNKDGRLRDYQRSRVYAAERTLAEFTYSPNDPRFTSTTQIQGYVNRLLDYEWFKKRVGNRQVEVKDGRGRKNAGGRYKGCGKGFVKLPRWARSELVILHEVAHAINDSKDRHGPRFCAIYLLLVERKMGKDVADRLRQAFREHNVDWSWRD